MVSACIRIEFDAGEGALSRLLGLVERRGFRIDGLDMHDGAPASLRLDLTARDATRQFDVLDLQLRRLHGVRDIAVLPMNTPNIARITP